MAPLLLFQNSYVIITPLHFLNACVLDNNTSAFPYAHGKDTWKYAAENPGHNKFFDEAMACETRRTFPAVLNGCAELFTGVNSVVDVGGGDGTLLRILIKKCPWIHGINLNLSHMLSSAPESIPVS
ncbi:acetylserotonin O-methyltransferase-like [Apium graveolens]|uniref:acetylserotonin O-methyltransferase-like n=1 Tax=Apium graveolens TaxID=4045 RepID=UPI003D78E4BF